MHNRIATFITPDITPAQRDEIIAAYLSPDITLTDLAASQNLSLPDLLAFLELPSTLETLDTLERIAARRDRLLSISARRCALDRLVQLVRVDPTERRLLTPTLEARARETSRRAAATLERLTRPKTQQPDTDRAHAEPSRGAPRARAVHGRLKLSGGIQAAANSHIISRWRRLRPRAFAPACPTHRSQSSIPASPPRVARTRHDCTPYGRTTTRSGVQSQGTMSRPEPSPHPMLPCGTVP